MLKILSTVKPVTSDHSRKTEKVVVVGSFTQVKLNVICFQPRLKTWSLFTGGRSPQVVVNTGLTVLGMKVP